MSPRPSGHHRHTSRSGIVIFGSPNSTIRNNNIHVKTVCGQRVGCGKLISSESYWAASTVSHLPSVARFLLIVVVDPVPWPPEGNFSHVIVEGNTISGGFATDVSRHIPLQGAI